eukprot:TRINITY_DN784_c0_g1_i4.p2 TRINITY_DN784_c0_g1~~TRINITY_DN784_c0_g1_i4.p2  ORF type:complete len:214 (-),score=32.37 TRINITY_DN784_c0_g1_i4:393-1034(-)
MLDKQLTAVYALCGTGFLLGLWYLKRNGLFKQAIVTERVFGPYLLVYKNYVGAFSGVGKVFDEVVSMADLMGWSGAGWRRGKTFGAYFDDPTQVEAQKLRSSIGVVWAENQPTEQLQKLKEELLTQESFLNSGYKVAVFPRSSCYAVEFPFRSYLSIMLAVSRAYPALTKYMENKPLPVKVCCGSFEVYDCDRQMMYSGFSKTERSELLPFDI